MATKNTSIFKRKAPAPKEKKSKKGESSKKEGEDVVMPSGLDMEEFYDYSSSEDESDTEDKLANNADVVSIDKKQKSGDHL
jgi:predicted secreted acid phosphatase